ncbi:MAG TPA: alpha/beta hydrolase [Bryobacteraceae bacterium]|nr:alpha/beta hydrolase [Bryobacteraceae bacterium]
MVRILLSSLVLSAALYAQAPRMPNPELLWPNGAPGALGNDDADKPAIFPYVVPEGQGTGAAVIVFPGGGYAHLSMDKEGNEVARWLNSIGITAFVLRYRLGPRYHHPIEWHDAQRAIRLVRSRATEYRILPNHIGVMGFSAGGHLASTVGTHFDAGEAGASDPIDRVSSRPDFLVLAYPVITMKDPYVHRGSRTMLLGENPDPQLVDLLSNETQVTAQTPPTFLFQTTTDRTVPVMNSVMFYEALVKAGVPAELHIYARGPHGVGLATTDEALASWPGRLADWLRIQGFLNSAAR